MGKRKLHKQSFYQCDWTGLPMKQAHCYWPSWTGTGKLCKKGSYCNWEAVVAHADDQYANDALPLVEREEILQHVAQVTGMAVNPAPHYEEMAHTKGTLTATTFHEACTHAETPITAIKLTAAGVVEEVQIKPDGCFNFPQALSLPQAYVGMFRSMRKKGKGNDRDLTVWYCSVPLHTLAPINQMASNLFKMQLYGDVLLVQQSREQSFLPRERYISFTKSQYEEQFVKKRKRSEAACMSVAGYAAVKDQMQQSLNEFEAKAAAQAVPPKQMASQSSVPIDGRAMAKKWSQQAASKTQTPPSAVLAAVK